MDAEISQNRKPVVTVMRGSDVKATLSAALEKLDGLTASNWDTVLIKPLMDYYSNGWEASMRPSPDDWVDPEGLFQPHTDKRVIGALVELFREKGAKRVVVGDGPFHETPAKWFFERTGMGDVVKRAGGELSYFDEEPRVELEIPDGRVLRKVQLPRAVVDCDLFVNVPKLKTEPMMGLTLGLSNLYGLLPYEERHRVLKTPQFSYAMVDLAKLVSGRSLTVVDAFIAMEGEGPRLGDPVQLDLTVAGKDPVATDAVAATLAGFEPIEGHLEVVPIAAYEGIGVGDLSKIEVRGESLERVARPFKRVSHPWIHPNPNVVTYGGGDSCGCRPWIQYTPMPWEIEAGKRYALIVGRTPEMPEDFDVDEVWVLGDISVNSVNVKKLEGKGIKVKLISGCPPFRLKEFLRLNKWEYAVDRVRCKYDCCSSA